MFYERLMEEFRDEYDCTEMDDAGAVPVFIFQVQEFTSNGMQPLAGEAIGVEGCTSVPVEFYASTPMEAVDQAHENVTRKVGVLMAKCVGICNYYSDASGAHVIFTKQETAAIRESFFYKGKKIKGFPTSEEFITNVLKRRKEMQEEGLLS